MKYKIGDRVSYGNIDHTVSDFIPHDPNHYNPAMRTKEWTLYFLDGDDEKTHTAWEWQIVEYEQKIHAETVAMVTTSKHFKKDSIFEKLQMLHSIAGSEPERDAYVTLLNKAVELGHGNDGLTWAYIKEFKQAVDTIASAIQSEIDEREKTR